MRQMCALAALLVVMLVPVSCSDVPGDAPPDVATADLAQVVPAGGETGRSETGPGEAGSGQAGSGEADVVPSAVPVVDAAAVADDVLGPDAVTTPNELAYLDTTVGTGPAVDRCDFVTIDYAGRTGAGVAFEGTADIGRPVRFSPGDSPPQVIAGLDQGVMGMQLGGARTVVVPPFLAVEPEGWLVMPPVPQGEVLILDVELVDLRPPPEFPELPPEVQYMAGEHGLEYAILEEGTGRQAAADDVVQIHYIGWLEGGTEAMDSSIQPAVGSCRAYVAPLGSAR